MLKKCFKYVTIAAFISLFSLPAKAQNCVVILRQAENLYKEGKIEQIPPLIKPCTDNQNSTLRKNEKLQALRLLTLVYLYEDQKKRASQTMLRLLQTEPEYEINATAEPAAFVRLFQEFSAQPKWAIHFSAGTNLSNIHQVEPYGTHNLNQYSEIYFSRPAFQVGLGAKKYLKKNFDLQAEAFFARNTMISELRFGFTNIRFKENQMRFVFPVSAGYTLSQNKFRPYLRAGTALSWLNRSSAQVVRSYNENSQISHDQITGQDIDMTTHRKKLNLWISAAFGLKYKISHALLFAEIRYNYGLLNQVASRYNNPELEYNYWYIDNDFRMNDIWISLGYRLLIYKPQKKTPTQN